MWPSKTAYLNASRKPGFFLHRQLARATPELCDDKSKVFRGYPIHGVGGYCVVVKVALDNYAYAARMLTSHSHASDWQTRYQELRSVITTARTNGLPLMDVRYYDSTEGVVVEGKTYPVVVMRWIEEPSLYRFLELRHNDSTSLSNIVRQLLHLSVNMKQMQIAHGDLHPKNMFILTGDVLRLIDYDSMWHRETRLKRRMGAGHMHFRHPMSTENTFCSSMDNFAYWSIYLSLIGLRRDPTLWELCERTDDGLLIADEDMSCPNKSIAFSRLSSTKDKQVRRVAAMLRTFLERSPEDVPPLLPYNYQAGECSIAACPNCGKALGGRGDLPNSKEGCRCWETKIKNHVWPQW